MGRCRIILLQGQKNEKCDVEMDSERVHKHSPFWVSGLEEIWSAEQYDLFVSTQIIGSGPTGKQTVLSLEKSHCLLPLMHFTHHHNFQTHLGPSRLMSIHTYILSVEAKASQNDRGCAISCQNTKYKGLVQYEILSWLHTGYSVYYIHQIIKLWVSLDIRNLSAV